MDTIRLVNWRGGMPPRYFTLSGADGKTLVQIVQELPYSRFVPDDCGGAYLVRHESLETLIAAGLLVTPEAAERAVGSSSASERPPLKLSR
jgi:hypothetical protein